MRADKTLPRPMDHERFPGGMVVLLAFLGLSLVERLVGLSHPGRFVLGPYTFPQTTMVIYAVTGVIALTCACYGILKRRPWARPLAITWLFADMALNLLNLGFVFLHPPQEMLSHGEELKRQYLANHYPVFLDPMSLAWAHTMLTLGIVASVPNLVAIVYLFRRRTFFRP